jgi:DUF971 family protein
MSEDRVTAVQIGPTKDYTALKIEWKDGHVSEYEPRYLRLRCPCAGCVDELTGEQLLTPDMVPDDIYPKSINYVGRYALQFFWSDGHDTGYYAYDFLRGICPCEDCVSGRTGP